MGDTKNLQRKIIAMNKYRNMAKRHSVIAAFSAIFLLFTGFSTAYAAQEQVDSVPESLAAYLPGGFIPGADGKATIIGDVSAAWPASTDTSGMKNCVASGGGRQWCALAGATVRLYKYPTTTADMEAGTAPVLDTVTTDENGVFQFVVEGSFTKDKEFNILFEYKGVKKAYGYDERFRPESSSYIKPRMRVRPLLNTEIEFNADHTAKGKLEDPEVVTLKRDQVVDWNSYLYGLGTNAFKHTFDTFGVMPIAWYKHSAPDFYAAAEQAFADYGTVITATNSNGEQVDLNKVTAAPGIYTITYQIGLQLPTKADDPLRSFLTPIEEETSKKYAGYPVFPREDNRLVTGSASLTVKVPAKLSYNANGGEGTVPTAENFMLEDSVVLAQKGNLAKGDAEFLGWNTQADGKGTNYKSGQEVTFNGDTVLYAHWKEAPIAPTKNTKAPEKRELPRTGFAEFYLSALAVLALTAGSIALSAAGVSTLRMRKH